MTDTLIGAYIGVGGVILGAILAGTIAYYYSKKLVLQTHRNAIEAIQITEHNKSVASFRAAFAPTLAKIYLVKKHGSSHEVPNIDKFLKDSLLVHATAIEEFRVIVPKSERTAYQEAWEKYRYEVWNYGFDANSMRTDIDNPYDIFEVLIHNILQFAKEK
jgi:hypothetical protein